MRLSSHICQSVQSNRFFHMLLFDLFVPAFGWIVCAGFALPFEGDLFCLRYKLKIATMSTRKETIKSCIDMSIEVIRMYDWMLDLFVLDFFVDDHWNKLPLCWRESFQNTDPQQLGQVLSGKPTNQVYPLSFLALISAVKALSIPRESNFHQEPETFGDDTKDRCRSHPNLKNLFLKHVKLKKRHEISLMARVVDLVAKKSGCNAVIDFGSGLGHLVRMLAYKYELYTAGIECQLQLTEEARKLDNELEYTASKYLSSKAMSELKRPIHINTTLQSDRQLLDISLPETMESFGLIGLHPCGDLGPLLLKHFAYNSKVKFICVVGCCFMKLTCDKHENGYPMSDYVKQMGRKNHLSYCSREIACHAIEIYNERLLKGQYEDLKVHAYRAALEKMLVDYNPELHHSKIRSVKHSDTLTFESYCTVAAQKLNIPLPPSPDAWSRGEALLTQWHRVVTVYTLRLALAPLVETVVLLDRVLFVLERGMECEIRPVFDPKLSPRNHIIIAKR